VSSQERAHKVSGVTIAKYRTVCTNINTNTQNNVDGADIMTRVIVGGPPSSF